MAHFKRFRTSVSGWAIRVVLVVVYVVDEPYSFLGGGYPLPPSCLCLPLPSRHGHHVPDTRRQFMQTEGAAAILRAPPACSVPRYMVEVICIPYMLMVPVPIVQQSSDDFIGRLGTARLFRRRSLYAGIGAGYTRAKRNQDPRNERASREAQHGIIYHESKGPKRQKLCVHCPPPPKASRQQNTSMTARPHGTRPMESSVEVRNYRPGPIFRHGVWATWAASCLDRSGIRCGCFDNEPILFDR